MNNRISNQLALSINGPEPEAAVDRLDLPDAEIYFYRAFFSKEESDRYFAELLNETPWRQEQIKWYGKMMDLPRLTAWYGDQGKAYRYSGITVEPNAWTPTLLAIKHAIEKETGATFNSVLLNRYRSGRDSVAWHCDDEPGLGPEPVIGSVSFGETRPFNMRHKRRSDAKTKIELSHGSYLLMKGRTQESWLHEIPKTTRSLGERINLTFRTIVEVPRKPSGRQNS